MSLGRIRSEDPRDADEPLDRRARLHQRRRERLLAVLPRLYAQQPAGSVVSVLLDAMAARLVELDEALERVLRDRWVALAGGAPPLDAGSHPLEGLARLLDLESEPWERADWTKPPEEWAHEADKAERFRRRVRQSAPVLTRGTPSVRSVLTLAAAAMDTELCPRLARLPLGSSAPDTTLGLGVRPGTRAHCPGCTHPEATEPCIWDGAKARRNPILARMLLTDSPLAPRGLHLSGLRHGDRFQVRNFSLAPDRPEVRIEALEPEPLRYPTLRNLGSNGTLLFAGTLEPGEVLILRPERIPTEVGPFQGYFTEGPALQFHQEPRGRALKRDREGTFHDVSGSIFFLQGRSFFDVSVFAGEKEEPLSSRFALLEQQVLSPMVEPGEVTWAYQGFTREDVRALMDPELASLLADAPDEASAGQADITLEWWTRPPASFRLRIPQVPPRDAGPRDGMRELVRRSVERARAAGVQVSVDFPEQQPPEKQPLGESPPALHLAASSTEDARMAERYHVSVDAALPPEKQPLGEEPLTTEGVFDVTRMDTSRFAP